MIYADPPWSYSGGGAKRNVTRHYHTMKTKDIYDLPVQDIAADDCGFDYSGRRETVERIRKRRCINGNPEKLSAEGEWE